MPIFFISRDQIHNETVTITGPLLDHLRASLRVKPGERIRLGDEHRRRYDVEVTGLDRRTLHGRIAGRQTGPAPRAPRLVLGQAILKGERMDWTIQKAVELGIHAIMPLISEQTVVRPRKDRTEAQQERWQRIALEAAQQSERWDIPSVSAPAGIRKFVAGQVRSELKLILAERSGSHTLAAVSLPSSPTDTIAIMIGPEGGWREEELDDAAANGFAPITLGARILRAETAALAAISVLQSRLGELG
jgi:16S rRNA (uracil1498-N3)-methyltransferase